MNIEEERKAYSKWLFSKDTEVSGFDTWLAAKEHAAEMAKLTVKIIRSTSVCTRYPWVVSLFDGETFNGVLEDFTTKEDAEAWARNCGYRVIE